MRAYPCTYVRTHAPTHPLPPRTGTLRAHCQKQATTRRNKIQTDRTIPCALPVMSGRLSTAPPPPRANPRTKSNQSRPAACLNTYLDPPPRRQRRHHTIHVARVHLHRQHSWSTKLWCSEVHAQAKRRTNVHPCIPTYLLYTEWMCCGTRKSGVRIRIRARTPPPSQKGRAPATGAEPGCPAAVLGTATRR